VFRGSTHSKTGFYLDAFAHQVDMRATAAPFQFTRFSGAGVPEEQVAMFLRAFVQNLRVTSHPRPLPSRKKIFIIACIIACIIGLVVGIYYVTK
jgi:hypothetical protein